ncbi:MAG: BamA/TamA family outer membrane protein [bacterium]
MKKTRKMIILALLLMLLPGIAFSFGKNKVQYRGFQWDILRSNYFDIYYYDGSEDLATRVAVIADVSCEVLGKYFSHELSTRIPILVYNSTNEFQQTNVTLEIIDEGVGGFTELFKNRVVIPFTGSYEELRHVIMHELAHVFSFDMLYGGLLQSIFTRQYVYQLPLWLIEGIAEYASEYWDTEAEMVMRDAAIHGYYFKFYEEVRGYLAYKQGQAVVKYIANRYGEEKIIDLMSGINSTRDVEKALLSTIGVDSRGLTEAWEKDIKKRYWPQIAYLKEPEDIGSRLTDHTRDGSFMNTMPSISPDGQKVVFLSDKSGYMDIYLMSAIDSRIVRRLVKGQRSREFESFHSLRSSMGWSPDGKLIVFVGKSGDRDRIYLIDSDRGTVRRTIDLDFDSVYRPAFSPDGTKIAFIGVSGGKSGIYTLELNTGEVDALATDALEYLGFDWSPDGKKIAFTVMGLSLVDSLGAITRVDPRTRFDRDIYVLDVADGKIERVTYCASDDFSPAWSPDGSRIIFVSDRKGSFDLYSYNFADSTTAQLTNVLGGIFSPSWSREGDRIVFSAFYKAGWDIYQVKEPLEFFHPIEVAKESEWVASSYWLASVENVDADSVSEIEETRVIPDTSLYTAARYNTRFSPDWLAGSLQYSSAFGLGGMTQLSLSDVLGNHRIYVASDLYTSIDESDFLAIYYYLPRRTDYGIGLFHFKNYYYSDRTSLGTPVGEGKEERLFSERQFGAVFALSYPLDKYRRFDFDFTAMQTRREIFSDFYYGDDIPVEKRQKEDLFIPRLSYVKDTTIWGETGPVGGTRYMLSLERSIVDLFHSDLSFTNGVIDYRRYFRFTGRTQLATRLLFATSQGDQPIRFFVGGATTIRGYRYFEFEGNNVLVANFELRYPFIESLVTRGPIPVSLAGVRGVFFFDIGGAWDGDIRALRVAHMIDGQEELKDLYASYGFGFRLWLAYFLAKVDFAWATKFNGTIGSRVHFTLGGEF